MLWRIYKQFAGCIDCVWEWAKKHFLYAMIILYVFIVGKRPNLGPSLIWLR